MTNKSQVTSVK